MKRIVTVFVVLLIVCDAALSVEKTIPQLIGDLAVQDPGNNTCNTACGILVMKKDEAIPVLRNALRNENDRVRYYSVRCLGEINNPAARTALIDAFSNGVDDVREHAAYALTWHPGQDAEQVYIDSLSGRDKWHVRHAIQALGEIRSKKAVPRLIAIRDNPPGWDSYYVALVALRKIESKELSPEVQASLDFLRKAKYSQSVDVKKLLVSAETIKANLQTVLPDVFDIFLWVTKGNESKGEPNAKTILSGAGRLTHAYVAIGLRDEDENVSCKAKELVEELGWQAEYEKDLQQQGRSGADKLQANEPNFKSTKIQAIEDFDGQKITIQGIYLDDPFPTINVTSHSVNNGRNIIRLLLDDSVKIKTGTKITIVGTVKAKNLKVPEIKVEILKQNE